METGRGHYNQQVDVDFGGLGVAAPSGTGRRVLRAVGRVMAAAPAFLSVLRRVTLDLGAIALVAVVVGYFISAFSQQTIVIESPSVPRTLQDRGLTPELLTQLIRARVQSIYAAAGRLEGLTVQETAERLPAPVPVELMQEQINRLYESRGIDAPAPSASPETVALNEAFPARNSSAAETLSAAQLRAAIEDSISIVTDEIGRALNTTRIAEIAEPPSQPLVIATAGLNLSIDSLAHAARQMLGIETQRRLLVNLLCETPRCDDEALSLHVVAIDGGRITSQSLPVNGTGIEGAIAEAGNHALRAYDPQVLAKYHFDNQRLDAAQRVARQMVEQRHAQAAWAENILGIIAIDKKQFDEAAVHLEAALAIDPDYIPALVNLGVARFHSDEFRSARDAFALALERDPEHVVSYINLGNSLLRLCSWEAAAAAYEQALQFDPQSAAARYSLELVKSIPQLKAYVQEDSIPGVGTAGLSDLSGAGIGVRRLDEVFEAAVFCTDLARKVP